MKFRKYRSKADTRNYLLQSKTLTNQGYCLCFSTILKDGHPYVATTSNACMHNKRAIVICHCDFGP